MKVLENYDDLTGKTIAFTHMEQFSDQITIATTDGCVLMATFEVWDDCDGDVQIKVLREPHVVRRVQINKYLGEELGKLGIYDLEAYKKEQERKRKLEQERFRQEKEEREKKKVLELMEKYSKELFGEDKNLDDFIKNKDFLNKYGIDSQ